MFLRSTTRIKNGKGHEYFRLLRTSGWPVGEWCSDTCCIWARSTVGRRRRGARRLRFSRKGKRVLGRWRCLRPTGWKRWPMSRWCGFGWEICNCDGLASGADAGWRGNSTSSCSWIGLGRSGCRRAAKGPAGIWCCEPWRRIGCWIQAVSGGCTGSGLRPVRWGTCWEKASGWRRFTSSMNAWTWCWHICPTREPRVHRPHRPGKP